MRFLLPAVLAAAQILQSPTRVTRSDPVLVTAVPAGDAIVVSTIGRVRLLGITAPAIGRAPDAASPFAREARARLEGIVLHRWIRLEYGGAAARQRAAYVVTGDGQFVNAVLVREGLARVSVRDGMARAAELKSAEAEARASRRGVWGPAPAMPITSYTQRTPKKK